MYASVCLCFGLPKFTWNYLAVKKHGRWIVLLKCTCLEPSCLDLILLVRLIWSEQCQHCMLCIAKEIRWWWASTLSYMSLIVHRKCTMGCLGRESTFGLMQIGPCTTDTMTTPDSHVCGVHCLMQAKPHLVIILCPPPQCWWCCHNLEHLWHLDLVPMLFTYAVRRRRMAMRLKSSLAATISWMTWWRELSKLRLALQA